MITAGYPSSFIYVSTSSGNLPANHRLAIQNYPSRIERQVCLASKAWKQALESKENAVRGKIQRQIWGRQNGPPRHGRCGRPGAWGRWVSGCFRPSLHCTQQARHGVELRPSANWNMISWGDEVSVWWLVSGCLEGRSFKGCTPFWNGR